MSDDEVGSVAQEARLLADALRRVGAPESPDATARLHLVTESADRLCQECGRPTDDPCGCRVGGWLHTRAPEVLRSLADVSSLMAEGLRVLAGSIEEHGRGGATDGGTVPEPEMQPETEERRQEQA